MNLVRSGGWAFIGRTPAIDNDVFFSYGLLAKSPQILKKTYGSFAVQYGRHIIYNMSLSSRTFIFIATGEHGVDLYSSLLWKPGAGPLRRF